MDKRLFINVRRPVCLGCIVFLILVYIITFFDGKFSSNDFYELEKSTVTVNAVVLDKQIKNDSLIISLEDISYIEIGNEKNSKENIRINRLMVYVSTEAPQELYSRVKLGAVLRVKGVFERFNRATNEGEFDAEKYYKIRGYDGKIVRARIIGTGKDYSKYKEAMRSIRDITKNHYFKMLGEVEGGVLSAMVLGDKSDLDTQIKEQYQNAGISHILALSGLHIATTGLALLKILKKCGLSNFVASLISMCALLSYAVMTGMSTSTIRAFIMFSLAVIANIVGRTYDILTAAALSAIMILIENPMYLYDSGFLLSFGAVIGISCLYPVLEEVTRSGNNSVAMPDKIRQTLCVSVSITLVTLPVMAYSFFQVSIFSFLLNLIVIPLMSVVLATGFAGMLMALILEMLKTASASGSVFERCVEAGSEVVFKITDVIIKLYNALTLGISRVSGNSLVLGRPGEIQCVIYCVIILAIIIIGSRNRVKKDVDRTGLIKIKNNDRNVTKIADKITLSILIFAAIFILSFHKREGLEIRNINVGQGDCILISGNNIPSIMIDGGSSDVKQVGKYKILPVIKSNKISCIDYCFISHMDADHVNGIFEILENETCGIRIKNLVVSKSYMNSKPDDEYYKRLESVIMNGKTKVLFIEEGNVFDFSGRRIFKIIGKDSVTSLRISCLSPGGDEAYEGNDSSVVLTIAYKESGTIFTGLFTGDISEKKEEMIKEVLPECSYLKVAHHGSKYSSSNDFLKIVKPNVAVISCGKDNSYGHPHKETLERIKEQAPSARLYRTDESGQITLKLNNGEAIITSFLKR